MPKAISDGKGKDRTFTRSTVYLDIAALHFYQAFADGQSQTGATKFSGGTGGLLGEHVKDVLELVWTYSDSGVCYFYPENRFFGGLIKLVNAYGYFTFSVNLTAFPPGSSVPGSGGRIADELVRHIFIHFQPKLKSFFRRGSASVHSVPHGLFTNTETDVLKHDLTGFDLGEVQDIVNDDQPGCLKIL